MTGGFEPFPYSVDIFPKKIRLGQKWMDYEGMYGSLEFVFYQSGVLVEIKGKKQSRRSHFLVQNAFQVIDSSAVAELRKQTKMS